MRSGLPIWRRFLVWLCVCWCVLGLAAGNALLKPAHRGMVWARSSYNSGSYNYMGVNCGGIGKVKKYDGMCGLCGDPFDGTRHHETGGKYATGDIAKVVKLGERTLSVQVLLNGKQGGYFEFAICDTVPETRDCLDNNLVKITEGRAQGDQFGYWPEKAGIIHLTLEIPDNFACDRCVLQWKYVTGNTWGRDELGQGCRGCGIQETFINCADIRIEGWSRPSPLPTIARPPPFVFLPPPTTTLPPTLPPTQPPTTPSPTEPPTPPPTTATTTPTVIQSKLTTNVAKQTTAGRLNFTWRRTDVDEGSRRRTNSGQQFTAKGVNPNRNFNYSPPQALVTEAVYAVKTAPPPVNPPTIQPVYEVKKFAVAPEIVANNPAAPVNIRVAPATQASVPAPGSNPSRSIPFPASAVAAVVIPHQSSVEPPLEKTTYVKRAVGDYGRGGGGGPAKIPRPPALSNLQISALNSRANVLSHPDKLQKYVQVGSSQMVVGKDFSTVYTSKNPTTAPPFYQAVHYSQSGMGQNLPQAVPYRGSYSRTGAQEQMFGTIPQGNNRNKTGHTGEIMNEYSSTNEAIMTNEQQYFGHSSRRGNGNVQDPWRVEARGSPDSTPPPQVFQRTYDRYGSLLEKTPAPRLGLSAPLKSDIMNTGSANGDLYTSNGMTDPGQSQSGANHRQFGNHNDKHNNQEQVSRDKQPQRQQAWYEGYGSQNIPPPQDNSRYNKQNARYGSLDNNWAPQPPKTTRLPVVDTSTHKETNNNNARQAINSWRRAPVHDAIDITPVPIDKPVNFFKNQDHLFRPPVIIKERFTNYEIGHKGTNQNGPTDTSRHMNTRNYDVPPPQATASLVDGRSQPLGGDTPTVQVPYEKIYDPSMKLTGQFGNRFQKSETPNEFWYQSGAGLNDLNGKPQMAESYVKPATTTQKPAIQTEIERKMAELKKLEELQKINNRLAQLKLILGLQVGITPVTIATTTTTAPEPFHYNNLQDGSMSLSKLDQLKLLLGLTETPTTTTARTPAAPSFDSQYGGDALAHGFWYNTEQGQQSVSPTQEAKLQQDLWIKLIRGDQGKLRSNVLSWPSKPTTQSYQTTTTIPTNTQKYIADFKTKMLQSIRSANALKGVSDTNGNVSGQSGVSWQQNRWREMSARNRNSQETEQPGQSSVDAGHWQPSESGAQLGYLKSTPDVQTMQYDSSLPNGARSVQNVETIYQTTTQAQPHTNSPSKNNLIAALRKLIAARSKSTRPPLREMHVENYIRKERINMTTTEAPSPQREAKAGNSSPSRGGNTSRFSKEQMDMIRRRVQMFKRMRDTRISRPTHITNTRTTNNDRPIHLPNTRPSHLGMSSNLGQEKKWTENNRPTHIVDHPNNNRPTVDSFLQSRKQNNLHLSGGADKVNNGGTTRSYQTPRSIEKSYQGHGSSTTRVPSANGALSPFQKLFLATAEKRLSASKEISEGHRERIKKESPVSKGAPLWAESTRDIAIKDLGVHGSNATQTVKENTQRVKPGPFNKDVLYKLLQALRDKNSATAPS